LAELPAQELAPFTATLATKSNTAAADPKTLTTIPRGPDHSAAPFFLDELAGSFL
jgi:hypothetical protein